MVRSARAEAPAGTREEQSFRPLGGPQLQKGLASEFRRAGRSGTTFSGPTATFAASASQADGRQKGQREATTSARSATAHGLIGTRRTKVERSLRSPYHRRWIAAMALPAASNTLLGSSRVCLCPESDAECRYSVPQSGRDSRHHHGGVFAAAGGARGQLLVLPSEHSDLAACGGEVAVRELAARQPARTPAARRREVARLRVAAGRARTGLLRARTRRRRRGFASGVVDREPHRVFAAHGTLLTRWQVARSYACVPTSPCCAANAPPGAGVGARISTLRSRSPGPSVHLRIGSLVVAFSR
jgi:hypothetical protein